MPALHLNLLLVLHSTDHGSELDYGNAGAPLLETSGTMRVHPAVRIQNAGHLQAQGSRALSVNDAKAGYVVHDSRVESLGHGGGDLVDPQTPKVDLRGGRDLG